jgi:queuine tRNA-ribosyltransferase
MSSVPERRKRSATTSPSPISSTRILLQCPDGVFPYLTPALLQICFPPDRVADVLLLGLAVRDTCLQPTTYHDGNKRKPRGYNFSSTTKVDRWMLPYQRVTVPTFDYLQDAQAAESTSSSSRNDQAAVTMTNQHAMMWTANGRHALTPAVYFHAAFGLASHSVVPLFDVGSTSGSHGPLSANGMRKRTHTALQRTTQWRNDFVSRCCTVPEHGTSADVWAPLNMVREDAAGRVPLPVEGTSHSQALWKDQLSDILNSGHNGLSGIVAIGWESLEEDRLGSLTNLRAELPSNMTLALLSTQTLGQILEVCSIGHNIAIGTNLPTKWACQAKALCVQLPSPKNAKRVKTVETAECNAVLDADGCVRLRPTDNNRDVTTHPWFRDRRPILPDCQCLTCRSHSRAYIYHLVCAKELLAEILLFIHNLHLLLDTVRLLSNAANDDERQLLYKNLLYQIQNTNTHNI